MLVFHDGSDFRHSWWPLFVPRLRIREEAQIKCSGTRWQGDVFQRFISWRRSCHSFGMGYRYSMDWFSRENLNRKPSIFPLNMGLSCNFSPKPIHWDIGYSVQKCQWIHVWREVFSQVSARSVNLQRFGKSATCSPSKVSNQSTKVASRSKLKKSMLYCS